MTYSIIARCVRTGQLGAAGTTSDIGLGARVPWLMAGVGAVVTQHRTDPRLGPRMLKTLSQGGTAADAVVDAVESTPHARWRQLAAIGSQGAPAAFSGDLVDREYFAEIADEDHVVVGNVLASPAVGEAISAAFLASAGNPLAERLMVALEAGLAAGGEQWPLRSAYLKVVETEVFPLIDVRVDEHAEPLTELRRLWELYQPWAREFIVRALDPDRADGVPQGAGTTRPESPEVAE
jgi:uncharacterized Ntn-hydrolase superfamily protein